MTSTSRFPAPQPNNSHHNIPGTQSPSSFIDVAIQQSITAQTIAQWDALKQQYQSTMSTTDNVQNVIDPSPTVTTKGLLNNPPTLPPSDLSTLLFNRYPLTFPNYLRLQPLSQQKQFASELASLSPHLFDLTIFSTKLHSSPALSLAYSSYLKYRKLFSLVQKPNFFHLNGSSPEFLSAYNKPDLTETQYIRFNRRFNDLVKLKTTLPQIQSYLSSFQTTSPQWALVSFLPLDVSAQSLSTIFSQQGGFQNCILLPPEPTSLTKIAFIAFDTTSSRDAACAALNGTMSPHPAPKSHKNKQQIPPSQNSTVSGSSNNNNNNSPQQSFSPQQYRLRVFPWVSSSQFELDTSHVTNTKPLHYRQPIAPVGFKQWLTGPIPISTLNHRLDKDIANSLLMAQLFDYIRLVPVDSGIDNLLEHLNRCLLATMNIGGGNSHQPPHHNMTNGNNNPSNSMLKFKFILRYLREVHLFDYFTTTLYPTKEDLNVDIGSEWFFLDPPPLSSNLLKHYTSTFTTTQLQIIPPAQPHFKEGMDGNTSLAKKEQTLLESTMYTPSLRTIPFDPALSPQQLALTAYYNTILTVSPPAINNANGPLSETIETVNNFWNLQHFYQQLIYPSLSPTSSGYVPPSTTQSSLNNPQQPHNDTIFTSGDINDTIERLFTTSNEQPTIIQPRYQSTDPNFWADIDSAAGQISALFDVNQIDRTTTPTIETMDPDFFYLPHLFTPPALTTSLSQLLSQSSTKSTLRATPVVPSALRLPFNYSMLLLAIQLSSYYKQTAPDRFKCHFCVKSMISQTTIIKHLLTQHPTTALPVQPRPISLGTTHQGPNKNKSASAAVQKVSTPPITSARMRILHNTIYLRYLYDTGAAALNPPLLSMPHQIFILNNFDPHVNEKRQFRMFTPQYRVHELITYKRHALTTVAIDKAWDNVMSKLREVIQTNFLADTKASELKDKTNTTSSLPSSTGLQRNPKLEQRAENYRRKLNLTQLFKGFDGDAFGTGRKLSDFNYLMLGDDNTGDVQQIHRHGLYKQIQYAIDTDTSHQITDHNNQFRQDYKDIDDGEYDFLFPSSYGLEPFAGQ